MSKVIYIEKEPVQVSEELYKEYFRMARRERYMQYDIKAGHIDVDMDKQKVVFTDSKEDSINRLMEQGTDFADGQAVEDIVCDGAVLTILQEALKGLDEGEQGLIDALYYKNLTQRQAAEREHVCQSTIAYKHKKILDKLKNILKNI